MTDLPTLTMPELTAAGGKLLALTRAADAACAAAGAPLTDAQYAALGELLAPFAAGLVLTERKLAARDEELADARRKLQATQGAHGILASRTDYHERELVPALRAELANAQETLGAVERYLRGILGDRYAGPVLAAGEVTQEVQRGRALVREVERLRAIEAAAQRLVDEAQDEDISPKVAGLCLGLHSVLTRPRQTTYDPSAAYPPIADVDRLSRVVAAAREVLSEAAGESMSRRLIGKLFELKEALAAYPPITDEASNAE